MTSRRCARTTSSVRASRNQRRKSSRECVATFPKCRNTIGLNAPSCRLRLMTSDLMKANHRRRTMTPRAKIDKATALLLRDYAFWGSLVLNLKVVERTDLPFKTLATDGVHLMYDPDYVEAHDLTTLITGIAHETGHVMFLHSLRRDRKSVV